MAVFFSRDAPMSGWDQGSRKGSENAVLGQVGESDAQMLGQASHGSKTMKKEGPPLVLNRRKYLLT